VLIDLIAALINLGIDIIISELSKRGAVRNLEIKQYAVYMDLNVISS